MIDTSKYKRPSLTQEISNYLSQFNGTLSNSEKGLIESCDIVFERALKECDNESVTILTFKKLAWPGNTKLSSLTEEINNAYLNQISFVIYRNYFKNLFCYNLGEFSFKEGKSVKFIIIQDTSEYEIIPLEDTLSKKLIEIFSQVPLELPNKPDQKFTCQQFIFAMMDINYFNIAPEKIYDSLTFESATQEDLSVGSMVCLTKENNDFKQNMHYAMYIGCDLYLSIFGTNKKFQIAYLHEMHKAYNTVKIFNIKKR